MISKSLVSLSISTYEVECITGHRSHYSFSPTDLANVFDYFLLRVLIWWLFGASPLSLYFDNVSAVTLVA